MSTKFEASPKLKNKLSAIIAPLYCTVIILGTGALLGWIFNIDFLKTVLPGHLSMRPNIAIGLILTGFALKLVNKRQATKLLAGLCFLSCAIGLVSFLEYILNFNLGFSSLGFNTPATTLGKDTPQRMDLISSLLLFLTASGLFAGQCKKSSLFFHAVFAFIASVSFLSLLGHLYGIKDLQGIRAYTEMGIHTSIAFLLIAFTVFIMDHAKIGAMSILLSSGPGGFVARKLTPPAIILPALLGSLKLFGENIGFFSTRFGTAILTSANIFAFIFVILWISILLQEAEKQRKETAKDHEKLKVQNELRDRFISTMSHDLRNPLNVIKLNAEMIRDFPEDKKNADKFARMILKSSSRIDYMIEGLLDAGKVEAGRPLNLNISRCDLNKVTAEALEDMKSLHGERFRIKFSTTAIGYWDCLALRRAFENLLSNALKYGSKEAPISIRIKQESVKTFLSVHNFGEHIPPDQIKKLFSSYQRLDSAVKSQSQGWGLGLTLVKGVANAHGGKVDVYSSPGYGTSFTLEIQNDSRQRFGAES